MIRFTTIVLLSISFIADALNSCPQDFLVYCPAITAPQVTELREGRVIIEYSLQSDGSVRDIVVVESTGDARWEQAVKDAVSNWLYSPAAESRQSYSFTAEFEE